MPEGDWKTANSDLLATHIFILRIWHKRISVILRTFSLTHTGNILQLGETIHLKI
jgi:hypothetical protein